MAAASSSTQSLKVWQVWPGSHQFFCDGRIMVGPDYGVTVFAFLLTTGTSVATWIFVGPSLPLAFTLCDIALYILTAVFMILTATTDPGIVPRCVRRRSCREMSSPRAAGARDRSCAECVSVARIACARRAATPTWTMPRPRRVQTRHAALR